MNTDFNLKNYEGDLIADIQNLIRIPSVKDETTKGEGAPFGHEVARALDWYLDRAREMGFDVKNVDGYSGHVEYGEGKDLVGVLVHLDVVPAGKGWDSEPFAAEIKGDRIVGRGVSDNKGPAMIALYALKAIKDSGTKLNKRIRIIAGTDEESGMCCIEHYFKHEEKPTLGFSPDADFPLIHAEKGILHLGVNWEGGGPLLEFRSGERPNVVPQEATAVIELGKFDLPAQEGITLETKGDKVLLTAKGRASHASVPEKGQNAAVLLLEYLSQFDFGQQSRWVNFLLKAGKGINGEGLGAAYQDEVSGKLTCNLGIVDFSGEKGSAVFDFRSPVTVKLEDTLRVVKEAFEGEGFATEVREFEPSHHVPKDSELVQKLLKVYREHTGDESEPLAIGGGTYARKLAGAVAFGPLLPSREDVAHIANECMLLEDIKLCLHIYTDAMAALARD